MYIHQVDTGLDQFSTLQDPFKFRACKESELVMLYTMYEKFFRAESSTYYLENFFLRNQLVDDSALRIKYYFYC